MIKSIFISALVLFCKVFLFAQVDSEIIYMPGKGITYNGHNYSTITLNGKEWMAENLRTNKYNDGTIIPIVDDPNRWALNHNNGTTLPMMCWYDNVEDFYTANNYGALYNWYVINPVSNGNKNICPEGWHVPTDEEWSDFINFIDTDADGGNNINTAGGKMKSKGTEYWRIPNADASNLSGFTGLPAGSRGHLGSYLFIDNEGRWWSSTEDGTNYAWYRYMSYDLGSVNRYSHNKSSALSVRCIKD
jgi:uncharacterized protein (TIGR02145 family)